MKCFLKNEKLFYKSNVMLIVGVGGVIHVNVICPLELRNEGNDYPLKI